MVSTQTLRGVSTVRFQAADLEAAKKWYTALLGIEPYFNRPGYTEFRIGPYKHELGLVDSRYLHVLGNSGSAETNPSGVVVYWHVDDLPATFNQLLAMGAKQHEAPKEFGDYVAASVIDPFGNILGIIYNPHWGEALDSSK